MDMKNAQLVVDRWIKEHGVRYFNELTNMAQLTEEVGEVASALAKDDKDELIDGIGDVVVTLIILAEQNGLTLKECLESAYAEIANRKGKTINGIFIKD